MGVLGSTYTGQSLPVLVSQSLSLYIIYDMYWSVSIYAVYTYSLYLCWSVSLYLRCSVSTRAVQSLPVHPGVECPTRLTPLTCLPLHTPTDHSLLSGLSTDHRLPHPSLLTSLSPPHQDLSPTPHHTIQNTSHPLQTPSRPCSPGIRMAQERFCK